jgi:hypothetical protein
MKETPLFGTLQSLITRIGTKIKDWGGLGGRCKKNADVNSSSDMRSKRYVSNAAFLMLIQT